MKDAAEKTECLNPNTMGSMYIDTAIYQLFSEAISHFLKEKKPQTYTEIVEGIYDYFKNKETKFDRSVEWYAVVVKNDMEARGIIDVFTEKGRKKHRLGN